MAELFGTDYFRDKIADKLKAAFPQATKEQLYDMIEIPNKVDNGDLSLPLPKLNKVFKVGNPAQAAAAAAATVRLFRLFRLRLILTHTPVHCRRGDHLLRGRRSVPQL